LQVAQSQSVYSPSYSWAQPSPSVVPLSPSTSHAQNPTYATVSSYSHNPTPATQSFSSPQSYGSSLYTSCSASQPFPSTASLSSLNYPQSSQPSNASRSPLYSTLSSPSSSNTSSPVASSTSQQTYPSFPVGPVRPSPNTPSAGSNVVKDPQQSSIPLGSQQSGGNAPGRPSSFYLSSASSSQNQPNYAFPSTNFPSSYASTSSITQLGQFPTNTSQSFAQSSPQALEPTRPAPMAPSSQPSQNVASAMPSYQPFRPVSQPNFPSQGSPQLNVPQNTSSPTTSLNSANMKQELTKQPMAPVANQNYQSPSHGSIPSQVSVADFPQPMRPAPPPPEDEPPEVLNRLAAREKDLIRREQIVEQKELELQQLEKTLSERAQRLNQQEAKIQKQFQKIREQNRSNFFKLEEKTTVEQLQELDSTLDVSKVTLCQKFARRWLLVTQRNAPKSFSEVLDLSIYSPDFIDKKQNRSRWHAMKEILQTERQYVTDLRLLVSHYQEALLPQVTELKIKVGDVQEIFANVEKILAINEQFYAVLEKNFFDTSCGSPKITESFQMFVPMLHTYNIFYVNFQRSIETRKRLASNSKYKAVIQQLQASSPTPNLDLDSYLIKPCQRLPRYILLLDAVVKHTPQEHADYQLLTVISEQIGAAVAQINERKREDEAKQQVLQLASKLNGPSSFELVQPSRRFLFEGPLSEVPDKSLRYHSKQNRTAYLFNDLLVLAKSKFVGSSFRITSMVQLSKNTTVDILPETNDLWNCFSVSDGKGKRLFVIADTQECMKNWVDRVLDVLRTYHQLAII